jgi:clan AA aspartic protease (TIGR02281 family)
MTDQESLNVMRKSRHFASFIAGLFSIAALLPVQADVITLKNGGTIEGIIVGQDSTVVKVDMGFGRTDVERAEIATIARSAQSRQGLAQEWSSTYVGHDRFVPPRCKACADSLDRVAALRGQAMGWTRANRSRQRTLHDLEKTVENEEGLFARMTDTLKTKGDLLPSIYYNALVKRVNALGAEMTIHRQSLQQQHQDCASANPYLGAYISALGRLKASVQSENTRLNRGALSSAEQEFFQHAASRIADFEHDVETTTLPASPQRNGSIVVTARINGKLDGRYIFDTGAGVMTISQHCAQRLGISLTGLKESSAILADGKLVQAKNVVLESVVVNGAEVRSVKAMILDREPAPGIDGLLGMTFLENFLITVDNTTGTIALKRFNQ